LYFQHIPHEVILAVNMQFTQRAQSLKHFGTPGRGILRQRFFMTISTCNEPTMRSEKAVRTCALTEIVRGSEGRLVDEMSPLVRRQDLSLDLSPVERIDAAGIAALISLYKLAQESGHRFSVLNVAPRVYELLALVGLEGILISHNANFTTDSGCRMTRNAA
jgi:anti-anti-sigma factor